jgi:chemotaxis family two-component system response regulator Rcp1
MSQPRFNILLVEDNAGDIYLFRKALKAAQVDFDLTLLEDGAQALAFVRGDGKYVNMAVPDLAVLDLNIPKNGGMQVLAALRQSPRLAVVPVIITSSSHSPVDQAETARLGIELYLKKPVNFEGFMEIGTIFREVLMRKSGRPKIA